MNMKTFINNYGLLSFTVDDKDYITNKGDKLDLPPDNEYVKTLVAKRILKEDAEKPKK